MGTVCEEYLDVVNAIVRDAYHYTYPRIILEETYVKSYGRYGMLPAYGEDSRWRCDVMQRAFHRMAKDEILRSKYYNWEVHPDFDAKRFYKVRNSANWVTQIYSNDSTERNRSRIALMNLENFLKSDIHRISGAQLIKLFGWDAGEGYDRLQIPSNIKPEPQPEPVVVDLTQSPSRTGTKRKRAERERSSSVNANNSETSSPIPLFTPMSSPPPLQSTVPSFQSTKLVQANIAKQKQEASASAQSGRTVLENKVNAANMPSQASAGVQPDRAAIENMVCPANISSQASPIVQSDRAALENMLSKHPWLVSSAAKLQERYPNDRFEIIYHEQTLKFKCHDCPKNLYKAIYPNQNLSNFDAHLKTSLHRQNVNARLSGMANVVKEVIIPTYSGMAKLVEQVSTPVSGRAKPAEQASTPCGARENSQLKAPSLVMIFPVLPSTGCPSTKPHPAFDSRSKSSPLQPPAPRCEVLESDDGSKRRRIDPGEFSTNPNTVKAHTPIANLDLRTNKYENAKANDEKLTQYYVENIVKRSAAYQNASQAERNSLEERSRSDYMDARRKMGKDAESYARSQGGYNTLTKEWGVPGQNSAPGANKTKNLDNEDDRPTIRTVSRAAIQALLRATLRHDENIVSLQKADSTLKDAEMRNSRLILAAEGKHDQLEARIETLEEGTHELPPGQAMKDNHRLATKLGIVEKRVQAHIQDIADAKIRQETTSKLTTSLSTISELHEQDIAELKHSAKRSKDWRTYLDGVMKEQKSRIDQLEAELQRQKQDKQQFKMATEGRVDSLLRHHQESEDAMMRRINALEKMVERQGA